MLNHSTQTPPQPPKGAEGACCTHSAEKLRICDVQSDSFYRPDVKKSKKKAIFTVNDKSLMEDLGEPARVAPGERLGAGTSSSHMQCGVVSSKILDGHC